ncbi:MAG: DUF3108 domain-containing protein [Candidatus Cloacimonetes bacterium]|nr:DUF3108 domain-containing protein [Candidatus Cloacimonadota bacterium]
MRISLFLLALVACVALSAERLNFSIRYIGIKVADVTIDDVRHDGGGRLMVMARSTGIARHMVQLDNTYESAYSGEYLPDTYSKRVHQKNYEEDRVTTYYRDTGTARRVSHLNPARNRQYHIDTNVRDFFTALYYIRNAPADEGELLLDAAGTIWRARYRVLSRENVRTGIGRIAARKVEFTFEQVDGGNNERSDTLTSNLVTRGDPLHFWFSDDDRCLPVRASFRMRPFPVQWVLEGIQP